METVVRFLKKNSPLFWDLYTQIYPRTEDVTPLVSTTAARKRKLVELLAVFDSHLRTTPLGCASGTTTMVFDLSVQARPKLRGCLS